MFAHKKRQLATEDVPAEYVYKTVRTPWVTITLLHLLQSLPVPGKRTQT